MVERMFELVEDALAKGWPGLVVVRSAEIGGDGPGLLVIDREGGKTAALVGHLIAHKREEPAPSALATAAQAYRESLEGDS